MIAEARCCLGKQQIRDILDFIAISSVEPPKPTKKRLRLIVQRCGITLGNSS